MLSRGMESAVTDILLRVLEWSHPPIFRVVARVRSGI